MNGADCVYEITSRLVELMKERGLNQKELAEKAGVTAATISRFKKQDRFDIATLIAVSRALDVAIEDLFMIKYVDSEQTK